ncbi:MAG: PAS domain S-box protein [Proteobacteria bacterium]|jgi:PAS domain S-box-containing protein|nr:PAS domain S-box protein [Pseudomonadota bacterium]
MDLPEILDKYHTQIVDTWVHCLLSDQSSRYAEEPEEELRPLVNIAAEAFRSALVHNDWGDLSRFVNRIARKRLKEGFKLSEVQKAFELYRQILTPLLISHAPDDLNNLLIRLHRCIVDTVTRFSEYFQNLHENFLRNQTKHLEMEVNKRTKELAESERKYKTLVEDINDGYFVLVDGRILFANKTFSQMHGYRLEEVLGFSYLNLVAPESRNEIKKAYADSLSKSHAPTRIEYLRLHRNGRRLATEIIAKLSSYDGKIANLGICRDISQRVELEKKTREAEKLKVLAQLAASLGHEIRNPLTAIKMNAQILSELPETKARQIRLVDIILKEIGHMERSVTEMMDLTIPFRLQCQWVALRPLLEGCLRMLQGRMAQKKITVSMRLNNALNDIWVDRNRIQQAIINLLFNAIEVLPRGGHIFLSSRIVQEDSQTFSEVRVADNGPGIPKELLSYAFDPFFSQKIGGTGLGLSNVRKIVNAHGGKVIVTPRKPKGINFCLLLPKEA